MKKTVYSPQIWSQMSEKICCTSLRTEVHNKPSEDEASLNFLTEEKRSLSDIQIKKI
jgi:hypothetical protein